MEWFGLGPGESYPDRRESALMGLYTDSVSDMHFPFTPPAENGGREQVRRVRFSAPDGAYVGLHCGAPMHFDAHHYTVSDIRQAMHEHELARRPQIIVHTDAAHAGIGGCMAWSTQQDEKYTIKPGTYRLEMDIEI